VRVLIAEDDLPLADAILRGLRRRALAVDHAGDGAQALRMSELVDYDVVVLDRDLPEVHGDTVCRELVQRGGRSRILMLTASATVGERVDGLAIGADDYLGKPFAMEELEARIRALGRRVGRRQRPVLRWRDVWVEPAKRRAGRDDVELQLTNREFAVLEELMQEGGAVLSVEMLMERVWDDRLDPFSNAVRVTMLTLRRKLGDPPIIETVPGSGYRLA
jgi:DNA-binding response OmpR family regulator